MSETVRRASGLAAAVAVVAATLLWGQHHAQGAQEAAQAVAQSAARQAVAKAADAVAEARGEVADQALSLAALDGMGLMMPVVNTADPEGYDAWLKAELPRWAKVIADAKIAKTE